MRMENKNTHHVTCNSATPESQKHFLFTIPVVPYGCICTKKIRSDEYTEAIQKTKAYKTLKSSLETHGYPTEKICIEVLPAKTAFRPKLEKLIWGFRDSPTPKEGPVAVIIVNDLFSLGSTEAEILTLYKILFDSKIGLLILPTISPVHSGTVDIETFSTVEALAENEQTKFRFLSESAILSNLQELSRISLRATTAPSRLGRSTADPTLPQNFRLLYWLYEGYFIKESEALNNELTGILKKGVFYNYCRLYEESPFYALDEEKFHRFDFRLSEKPKRFGVLDPAFSDWLINTPDHAELPHDERLKWKVPSKATSLTLQRYRLKALGGKSAMSRASHRFYMGDILSEMKNKLLDLFKD